jgi:toxin ParE1/3/4
VAELDISPQARQDLVEIRIYSLEQFGPVVADVYFLGFDQAFDRLARHPHVGVPKPELGSGVRCLVHRRHRIFYIIEDDVVVIVRIIHHACDTRSALKS